MRPRPSQTEDLLLNSSPHNELVSRYTILAVCCSCVGGLMFGYDTSLVNSLLVLVKDDLGHHLTSTEKELITSITSVGALVGSICAGVYSDKIGRKMMIGVACVAFIASAVVMASAVSVLTMMVGRFVAGVGIGCASSVVPVYIAEIASPRHRGKLVTLNAVTTTFGQVVALLAGWQFARFAHGWRLMLAIGAIPPLIFLLAIGGVPESPRFLIKRERIAEAEAALHKLHPNASFQDIQDLINEQAQDSKSESFSFKRLLHTKPRQRALIVACGLMALQQLCGINVFMYYSSTLFESAGFSDPIFMSMTIVCGVNFLFSWTGVVYVDTVGRRRMLLYTLTIMVLALIVTAFAFGDGSGTIMIISTVVYIAAYTSALGSVPWQSTEFMPLDVRSLGSMMISATNWIFNALVSITFLTALDVIKPKGVFLVFAMLTFTGYVGVYFCYPEVAGMRLEDIPDIFETRLTRLGKVNSLN